ncbi:hypothetical protein D3OALGB2SA_1747 [Olavius algarvensis associated proteobacterium Delta 3]|nr:hypothetical protein D3OALGB2SA_1747 [Olavius algarvensis associated proteobacterium Delta 3]
MPSLCRCCRIQNHNLQRRTRAQSKNNKLSQYSNCLCNFQDVEYKFFKENSAEGSICTTQTSKLSEMNVKNVH